MKDLYAVIIIIMKEHTGKGQQCQLSRQGKAWMETWRLREGKGVERGIQKDWRGLVK